MKNNSLLYSIVRIESGKSLGTGCLLQGGLVLTCTHIIYSIADVSFSISDINGIFCIKIDVEPIPKTKGEFTVFKIKGELPSHSVSLMLSDENMSKGNTCAVYGFPKRNTLNGIPFNGSRIDSFESSITKGHKQIILNDAQPITNGFSGSPIYDTKLGLLVGMLLQRHPETRELARGVPAGVIASTLEIPIDYSPCPYIIKKIDSSFLLNEKKRSSHSMSSEAFYVSESITQWWGVMNGLVAERKMTHDLIIKTNRNFYEKSPIISLFIGSSGMGKSTAARHLVVSLSERFECWWIDDFSGEEQDETIISFIEYRAQLDIKSIFVIDDWGKHSVHFRQNFCRFMYRQYRNNEGQNVRFVITAKTNEYADLGHELLALDAIFDFDNYTHLKIDNISILKKAIENLGIQNTIIPQNIFENEDHFICKPFHLLFTLLRETQDFDLAQQLKKTVQNAESKFRTVIQYDFDRLYQDEEQRGLAISLLFFAYVKVFHGLPLPFEAFTLIADYYSSGKILPGDRMANQLPSEWGIISYYIKRVEKDTRMGSPSMIKFKNDEYPEQLLKINLSNGKSAISFLNSDKKHILTYLMKRCEQNTVSILLYIFSQREHLITEKEAIIEAIKLLDSDTNNQDVIFSSLYILRGNSAEKIEILKLIEKHKDNIAILKRCFSLLPNDPEVKVEAIKLIRNSNDSEIILLDIFENRMIFRGYGFEKVH